MRCYNCGFEAEGDVCVNCGAPLKTYRHIMNLSYVYYNDGLDRAKSRDLSGAARSLEMCLKLDKNNIDARNLLGLIFYETGETVQAITQWVVSKNLQQDENRVDTYLEDMRRSPDRLDAMNRAIKKYNFALKCAKRGNTDVATVHLKKVLQLNPRFLKARQMLALLYIRKEDYARARYELQQCAKIDTANDKTLRYQTEIDRVARMKQSAREEEKAPRRRSQAVAYRSGNDTIIQPAHRFGSGGALSLISVAFGLGLGVLAMSFLVMPNRIRRVQWESNERIAQISEESDLKTVRLNDLERRIEELETEELSLSEQIAFYEGITTQSEMTQALVDAAALILAEPEDTNAEPDISGVAAYMEKITAADVQTITDAGYGMLYQSVVAEKGEELSAYYFERAADAMMKSDYAASVRLYGLAAQYNAQDEEALYNYAEATRLSGDTDNAKLLYDRVLNEFPDSRRASDAEARIAELNL